MMFQNRFCMYSKLWIRINLALSKRRWGFSLIKTFVFSNNIQISVTKYWLDSLLFLSVSSSLFSPKNKDNIGYIFSEKNAARAYIMVMCVLSYKKWPKNIMHYNLYVVARLAFKIGTSVNVIAGQVRRWRGSQWQAVCASSGFDQNAAAVVCRSLGFAYGRPEPGLFVVRATTRYVFYNIRCVGNEASFNECRSDYGYASNCPDFLYNYGVAVCSGHQLTSKCQLPIVPTVFLFAERTCIN